MNPELVESMIQAELPDSQVQVISPDGSHFEVTVISPLFAGKRRVQQHQMVYGAVKEAMATEVIHAMALNTFTPEEWATRA
ncbi:MAG: BolA/IbaG family iron-sulfur metabolism protein [Synechococcales bacterium]|nr:BolA/IbaG family iron-sulfur metabolism protein [Synechococcales bacterium]